MKVIFNFIAVRKLRGLANILTKLLRLYGMMKILMSIERKSIVVDIA